MCVCGGGAVVVVCACVCVCARARARAWSREIVFAVSAGSKFEKTFCVIFFLSFLFFFFFFPKQEKDYNNFLRNTALNGNNPQFEPFTDYPSGAALVETGLIGKRLSSLLIPNGMKNEPDGEGKRGAGAASRMRGGSLEA